MTSLSFVYLLLSLAPVADANAFLGPLPHQNAMTALSAEADHALLAELEVALGKGHRDATEKRIQRFEQMLRPMFGAMAKNEHSKLGSAAAGYILHRVFVQRHGWSIRALEPAGKSLAAWNTSTPTSILEKRVPTHVQNLFEKRLREHGLDLKELAILAATLEHLVHTEALQRLNVSYLAKSYSQEDHLNEKEAMDVIDIYMSVYIAGFLHTDLATMTPEMATLMHENIIEFYPSFPETQDFYKEVYKSVAPKRDYIYFNEIENVIAEIGERYGSFQDNECRQFKDWLLAVEDSSIGGAGRVRISDFYGKALNDGKWQFSESVHYLRQLGALDDSDPSNLRVIIPNYLYGPSNCVASSAYYSVCCLDECEGILGRLEEMVVAPEASASTIANSISMIASATMPSNRTLAPWLLKRLDEIAKYHGGIVPLHGRLFLQWLHYAYPRECSFPHASGTIDPRRPEDLVTKEVSSEVGTIAAEISTEVSDWITANETVMKQVVAKAVPGRQRLPGAEAKASEESAMWTMDEELVVWQEPHQAQGSVFGRFGAPIAMVAAAASLSIALLRSLGPALRAHTDGCAEKYLSI